MSDKKHTKLAESGIINCDAWLLVSHAQVIPIDDQMGRYSAAADLTTENNVYENELVCVYETDNPQLVQAAGKYQTAEDNQKYVFSTINRMPHCAKIVAYGVSMGQAIASDRSTHKLSIALEGTFSIPNTGDRPFQQGDFCTLSLPPSDSKFEPVYVGKQQKGRLYPPIFPYADVKAASFTIGKQLEKEMDSVLEQLKNDARTNGKTLRQQLKDHIDTLRNHQSFKKCFETSKSLEESLRQGTSIDPDAMNMFGLDCFELMKKFDAHLYKNFFAGILIHSMYVNELLLELKGTGGLNPGQEYTYLHGKMISKIQAYSAYYSESQFKHLKANTFAYVLQDSKIGERVNIFLGRTPG